MEMLRKMIHYILLISVTFTEDLNIIVSSPIQKIVV